MDPEWDRQPIVTSVPGMRKSPSFRLPVLVSRRELPVIAGLALVVILIVTGGSQLFAHQDALAALQGRSLASVDADNIDDGVIVQIRGGSKDPASGSGVVLVDGSASASGKTPSGATTSGTHTRVSDATDSPTTGDESAPPLPSPPPSQNPRPAPDTADTFDAPAPIPAPDYQAPDYSHDGGGYVPDPINPPRVEFGFNGPPTDANTVWGYTDTTPTHFRSVSPVTIFVSYGTCSGAVQPNMVAQLSKVAVASQRQWMAVSRDRAAEAACKGAHLTANWTAVDASGTTHRFVAGWVAGI